jgi:hypothetical protein
MRKSLLTGLLVGSAALLLSQKSSRIRRKPAKEKQHSEARSIADQTARRYITYAIIPAWTISGFLDWLWHKQTKIETTSGTEESITHLLMMTEAGLPIMLALFLEINAGVIAMILGGWLLHQATVYWDLAYTAPRRPIYVREQMTHLFMQTVPFDILAMLACLHPGQFKALFGAGEEPARFELKFRRPGMSPLHALTVIGAVGAFSWLPHVEELWRCWQAQKKGLTEKDTPECARVLFGGHGESPAA